MSGQCDGVFGPEKQCVPKSTRLTLAEMRRDRIHVGGQNPAATKRAIDEAIYEANISNVSSVHRDFDDYGFAYDLALLDAKLDEKAVNDIINRAASLTGDAAAIRSVRQAPA